MSKSKVPLFGEDEATAMLAKAIALHAFRNPLEDLHAGITPSSKTGDYSDVKVVTPYGEIPWNRLSRISDDEMKVLMIDVVSRLFTLLVGLDDKYLQASISVLSRPEITKWDEPSIRTAFKEGIMNPIIGSESEAAMRAVVQTILKCETGRRLKARDK